MGFWDTVIASTLAGLFVVIALGVWSRLKSAPHFVRSFGAWLGALPSRFPLRVVKTSTLSRIPPPVEKAPYVDVPDAPQDGPYRAEPQKPKPLSLRQRCQRLSREIEEEIGRRDSLSVHERRGLDNYAIFIPEVHSLQEELVRYEYQKEGGRLYRYAYAEEWLSRTDVLVVAEVLRGINWDKPPSGTVSIVRG